MKKKYSDIVLLVVVFALFGASIGILHGRKKIGDSVARSGDSDRVILSLQDSIDYLQPFLIAGNMDNVASTLHQFSEPVLFEALEAIIGNRTIFLTDEQKVKLLVSAILYDPSPAKRKTMLSLLIDRFKGLPVFAYAAYRYKDVFPLIKAAARKMGVRSVVADWKQRSIDQAIKNDDVDLLTELYTNDIRPTSKEASRLLHDVVVGNKNVAFVPLLVRQLGAQANYSSDGKRTLLIEAVQKGNSGMVQALLDVGSDAKRILNPAIGSARQVAYERGYALIEQILREHK